MQSLTRDQVRAIDRCAIQQLSIPGLVLMENAGRNAAQYVRDDVNGIRGRRISIVAGAGNNGGDGFVVARHLANWGARVTTFLVAPPEKITGDAAVNLQAIRNLGHEVIQLGQEGINDLAESLAGSDRIIDAIGGTGITGALRGDLAAAVEQINAACQTYPANPVLCVDIPTGLDADTGRAEGPAVYARATVTFVARKKGFDEPGSRQFTGAVHVADIGIDPLQVARLAGVL